MRKVRLNSSERAVELLMEEMISSIDLGPEMVEKVKILSNKAETKFLASIYEGALFVGDNAVKAQWFMITCPSGVLIPLASVISVSKIRSNHSPNIFALTMVTVKTISTIELEIILKRKKIKNKPITRSSIGNPLIVKKKFRLINKIPR